ncbi:MAG: hypothetical protein AAF823_10585 [Planctomycetota bacterium]
MPSTPRRLIACSTSALVASLGAVALPAIGQTLVDFDNEAQFGSLTNAFISSLPAGGVPANPTFGGLTVTAAPGSTLAGDDFSPLIEPIDFTFSGVENWNVDGPFMTGFGFEFVPHPTSNLFEITLLSGGAGGTVVGSTQVTRTANELGFVGVATSTPFNRIEIRDLSGNNSNDVFGRFSISTSAVPTWNGGDGDWDTASNWSTGSVPNNPNAEVLLVPDGDSTIAGPAAATSVGSLTIDNQTTTPGTFVGQTTLNLGAGPLTVGNALSVGAVGSGSGFRPSTLNVGTGTLTVGGETFIQQGGEVRVDSGGTFDAGSAVHIDSGTLAVADGGTFVTTGTTGTTVNLNEGTLEVPSLTGLNLNWTEGTVRVNGAAGLALNLNGDLGPNPVTIANNRTLDVTNTLTINSAAIVDVDFSGRVDAGNLTTFLGTLNANGGQVVVSDTLTNQGTVNITGGGNVTATNVDASAVAINHTGGSLRVDGGTYTPFAGTADFDLAGTTERPILFLVNGASLDVVGDLNVARGISEEAQLFIQSGSSVTTTNMNLGDNSTATSTFVGVDDAGSMLTVNGSLEVGNGNDNALSSNNREDILRIDGGEAVVDGVVTIGTTGAVIVFDGQITAQGWVRNASSDVDHTGGTIRIETGNFSSGTSDYRLDGNGTPTLELADGATSSGVDVTLRNAEVLLESGATYTITDLLETSDSATASKLTVTGAGSEFTAGRVFFANANGADTTVDILDGGSIVTTLNSASSIADDANSTADVTIDGAGSRLIIGNNSDLTIGNGGAATIDISDGGLLQTGRNTRIGLSSGGSGVVTVTGAGSKFDTADGAPSGAANDFLVVGQGGSGELNILDGATAEAETLIIGETNNAFSATVTVDGAGSTIDIEDDLRVGDDRQGTMTVSNGAVVNVGTNASGTHDLLIGTQNTADGSDLIVDGGTINHLTGAATAGRLAIGDFGNSADRPSLQILNGGVVDSDAAFALVADQANSTGELIIDGDGSLFDVQGTLLMGDNGSGIATIRNGGDLVANVIEVSAFGGGTGTMTVTGPGSTVTAAASMAVGDQGTANGSLLVEDGATVEVTNGDLNIARLDATSNGSVIVRDLGADDGGSTLTVGDDLTVGGADGNVGGTGSLTVGPGGTVSVANVVTIRDGGTVTLDGGSIIANIFDLNDSNPSAGSSPSFVFNSGAMVYRGDELLSDSDFADLLGNAPGVTPTLGPGQTISVEDLAVLEGALRLDGGVLAAGSFADNDLSTLDWDSGTLIVTDSAVGVGAGQLFEGTLFLGTQQQLVVIGNGLTIDAGSSLVAFGGVAADSIAVEGELVLADGSGFGRTIASPLTGGGEVTLLDDAEFLGAVDGTLDFFGAGTATFTGGISPGNSPGTITVESDAVLSPTNTLTIEIESVTGPTGPAIADELIVGGEATVDGTLDVDIADTSVLSLYESFRVVDAGEGLTGRFATIDGVLLGTVDGVSAAAAVTYAADGVDLTIALAADADLSGSVDTSDLAILAANFGSTDRDWATADFNGDGVVDTSDLAVLAAGFGVSVGPGAAASAAAVPEPTTAAVALMAGVAGLLRRRR